MKSTITLLSTLILSAIFWGCATDHHPTVRHIDNGVSEDCRISQRSGHLYQIKEECAMECIDKYERYLKIAGQPEDRELRYVAIDIRELKRVLNRPDVDITRDSTLFVRMAIMPNHQAGAVLAVRKKSANKKVDAQHSGPTSKDFLYFDFTAPCPTMCPL